MNKKVLSKKVMISLLTISCVYLGGTSVLPMAEAAMGFIRILWIFGRRCSRNAFQRKNIFF